MQTDNGDQSAAIGIIKFLKDRDLRLELKWHARRTHVRSSTIYTNEHVLDLNNVLYSNYLDLLMVIGDHVHDM